MTALIEGVAPDLPQQKGDSLRWMLETMGGVIPLPRPDTC